MAICQHVFPLELPMYSLTDRCNSLQKQAQENSKVLLSHRSQLDELVMASPKKLEQRAQLEKDKEDARARSGEQPLPEAALLAWDSGPKQKSCNLQKEFDPSQMSVAVLEENMQRSQEQLDDRCQQIKKRVRK